MHVAKIFLIFTPIYCYVHASPGGISKTVSITNDTGIACPGTGQKSSAYCFFDSAFFVLSSIPGLIAFSRIGQPAVLLMALAPLGIGVYGFFRYNNKKKDYASEFKEQVIRELFRLTDPNLAYYPEQHINESDYREADIVRNPIDRYSGDDLVEGTLGVTRCRFSELEHQEKKEFVDSKGRRQTSWVTIFKGIFFIADFNKHFIGRTYVFPDAGSRFLGIGKLFKKVDAGQGGFGRAGKSRV